MADPARGAIRWRNAAIALAILALAAVAGIAWWRGRAERGASGPADGGGVPPATRAAGELGEDAGGDTSAPAAGDDAASSDAFGGVRRVWRERLGDEPVFPDPLHGAASCERVERELRRVCDALDAALAGDGPATCELIDESAARLDARRPRLPEARDPESWTANAFHVFRALGSSRLAAARRLIEVEPALVEPLALAAYRWAVTREACRGDDETAPSGPSPSALYDYGALAFTSFGGQAYLRRRAPRLEALGCFYALSALELSIEQGHNPLGVDPRAEIGRCRALVASQPLVWSGAYERELSRIERAWARRAGG